jgi:hypothetical protein
MTLEDLCAKVRKWDSQNTGSAEADSHFETILNQLYYHAAREWRVFLPAEHPDFNSSYMDRLASWIGNLSDEADQKSLLEYSLYISFFSHDDFIALYCTAMEREIKGWVASQIGASLEPNGWHKLNLKVNEEIHRHTWFCPVTDSMDINEFYKVNHLKGVGHRPGFATLQMLAEKAAVPDSLLVTNIIHYMENPSLNPKRPLPKLHRLVLLEDIVGSGAQCIEAVKWAVANIAKPILFVPLILCPNGADALQGEAKLSKGRLSVQPIISIRRGDLLGPERKGYQGWPITETIENLANRCAHRASSDMETFGYKNTGCSVATFSNTPNNTLPLVHNKPRNGAWSPLFPRVYRD